MKKKLFRERYYGAETREEKKETKKTTKKGKKKND